MFFQFEYLVLNLFMNNLTNIEPVNKELNLVKYETIDIKNLIYCIRGKQVMLDSDVAMLYRYETKKINQTVKRNIERFPENFCFQLTQDEFLCLRSQFATLLKSQNMRSQIETA